MDFRYSGRWLWLLLAGAFGWLGLATLGLLPDITEGRFRAWNVLAESLRALVGVFFGIAWLRCRRLPWVVRLTPTHLIVKGWRREESLPWEDVPKRYAPEAEVDSPGQKPIDWGARLSGSGNSPWVGIDRRWVINGDVFDAVIAFYLANPASRNELGDAQACAKRLEELRRSSLALRSQQAQDEAQHRDSEEMRRGREWPSDGPPA